MSSTNEGQTIEEVKKVTQNTLQPVTMATSRIAVLASRIAHNTAEVEKHLLADGLPCPTFDADQPPTLVHNPKIAAARRVILVATD